MTLPWIARLSWVALASLMVLPVSAGGLSLAPIDASTLLVTSGEGESVLRALDAGAGRWSSQAEHLESIRVQDVLQQDGDYGVLGLDSEGQLVLLSRTSSRILASLAGPEIQHVRAEWVEGRLLAVVDRGTEDEPHPLLVVTVSGDEVTLEETPWRTVGGAMSQPVVCGEHVYVAWRDATGVGVARLDGEGTALSRHRMEAPEPGLQHLELSCSPVGLMLFGLGEGAAVAHLDEHGQGERWRRYALEPGSRPLHVAPFADLALLATERDGSVYTQLLDLAGGTQAPERLTTVGDRPQVACTLHAEELACVVMDVGGEPELHMLTRDVSEPHDARRIELASLPRRAEARVAECGSPAWGELEQAVARYCASHEEKLCGDALVDMERCIGAQTLTLDGRSPQEMLFASGEVWLRLAFVRGEERRWRLRAMEEVGDVTCGSRDWQAFASAVEARCENAACAPLGAAFAGCESPQGAALYPIDRHDAVLASSVFYFVDDYELLFTRDGDGWLLDSVRDGYDVE